MRKAILVALLAISVSALAADRLVRQVWLMEATDWGKRDGRFVAYCLANADFEVKLKCSYLAELNMYVWQLHRAIPPKYQTDFVLFGEHGGAVCAQQFTPTDGAAGTVTWITVPAPTATVAGTTATISWAAPVGIAPALVQRYELVVDGAGATVTTSPVTRTLAVGTHTAALRVVLAGTKKRHQADSTATQIKVSP